MTPAHEQERSRGILEVNARLVSANDDLVRRAVVAEDRASDLESTGDALRVRVEQLEAVNAEIVRAVEAWENDRPFLVGDVDLGTDSEFVEHIAKAARSVRDA